MGWEQTLYNSYYFKFVKVYFMHQNVTYLGSILCELGTNVYCVILDKIFYECQSDPMLIDSASFKMRVFIFAGYIPRSGITGSYGSTLSFLEKSILFFIVAVPIYISPTMYGVPFSPHLRRIFFFWMMKWFHPWVYVSSSLRGTENRWWHFIITSPIITCCIPN